MNDEMKEQVLNEYFENKNLLSVEPFGNGHINDTYRITSSSNDTIYVLQRVNTSVFPDMKGLVDNHKKLQEFFNDNVDIEIPRLIKTQRNEDFFTDSEGESWRLISYIKDSYCIEIVSEEWEANEAGNAFGYFAKVLAPLNADNFVEAIENFHSLTFRLWQLKEAIKNDAVKRVNEVADILSFYKIWEKRLFIIEQNVQQGSIPIRVVHNDTKINNLLFRNGKACAVIDLDTLGPGTLYYDYGDALRTIGNSAAEDEKDLDKVKFEFTNFKAFSNSYLTQVKPILTPKEKEYFYLAPFLMTYIMGIRFLADYLNGDIYYKTAYSEHNLVRTKVQMRLMQLMTEKEDEIKASIKQILKS